LVIGQSQELLFKYSVLHAVQLFTVVLSVLLIHKLIDDLFVNFEIVGKLSVLLP